MFHFDSSLLRPEWMRAPCWRWNVSMGYLANRGQSLAKVRKDPYLYEGAQYYRDKKHYSTSPTYYLTKYPELSRAHDIFYHSHFGGWRWYIEALMIAGLDDMQIREALKVDIPADVVKLYRKLFFDVDAYLDSEIAVCANIFSTARLNLKGKRDCDYTWKLFAYSHGAEAFMQQFAGRRTSINMKYARWFRDLAKERLTINAFQLSSDLQKTYNLETLEILKIAKDYWTITDTDMQKAQVLADTDFVSSLSGHIDMCLMNATEKSFAVENRANFQYAFDEPAVAAH